MDTAFFIVTNRCSKSCSFCFYFTHSLSHPASEMGEKGLFNALERLAALGVRQLIITGGEPLIRAETAELIRRSGALGMTRLLLTNGDLLDRATARGLLDCGLEGLSLSVNSRDDARRLEGAAALLRGAPRMTLTATTVFTRENAGDLGALYEWASRNGLGAIFQPAYIPVDSKQFGPLSPHRLSRTQWEIAATLLREWGLREHVTHYVDFILSLYGQGGGAKPRRCAMGSQAFVLDCDGTVYPCFHRRDLKAGNVFQTPEEVIVKNLEYSSMETCNARCYGEHCVSLFYGQHSN
ncbi:MAG: radical SAM protein [Candidatus Aureabacteria bacterium]|nr:radical SAM protein [Candidatus Auribacterota bacterium]